MTQPLGADQLCRAGHADIKTTMQYVHVAGSDLHDAISRMHERREALEEA